MWRSVCAALVRPGGSSPVFPSRNLHVNDDPQGFRPVRHTAEQALCTRDSRRDLKHITVQHQRVVLHRLCALTPGTAAMAAFDMRPYRVPSETRATEMIDEGPGWLPGIYSAVSSSPHVMAALRPAD